MANKTGKRTVAKKLSIGLPFGIGQIELEEDETQQRAAWAVYVELMTRVAVQPLDPEHGLLREALNSLYALFSLTRQILRDSGPQVAADGEDSFGSIAIRVLNEGIRPFTSKWHPRLLAHERARPSVLSEFAHEQQWEFSTQMRQELDHLQRDLEIYAEGLAKIAGVKHVKVLREISNG